MSMWLNFVRVTPETFKKIKAAPDLLEAVWFSEGKKDAATLKELGIDPDKHVAGLDYLTLSQAFEAMEEDTGDEDDDDDEEDDPVTADLSPTGTLEYDAGYDEAFYLDPKAVTRVAKDSSIIDMDEDVKKLFDAAANAGQYVIGVIS